MWNLLLLSFTLIFLTSCSHLKKGQLDSSADAKEHPLLENMGPPSIDLSKDIKCWVIAPSGGKEYLLEQDLKFSGNFEKKIDGLVFKMFTEGTVAAFEYPDLGVVMFRYVIYPEGAKFVGITPARTDKNKSRTAIGETAIVYKPGEQSQERQMITYYETDKNRVYKLFCNSALPWWSNNKSNAY